MSAASTVAPVVSVVMSVYNGACGLADTLASVLGQEGPELELIVIDDGSTDGSTSILDNAASRDPRVRVIHQPNSGLTRALIRGCAAARGRYIARQDAADLSLPHRFSEQTAFLDERPDAMLVASTVRFVAPGHEWLFDHEPAEVVEIDLDIRKFRVPSLLGAMFRRDAYERVGGFRPEFVVAQDVDLWLRLIELGPCLGLRRPHYRTTLTLGGISSRNREAQAGLTRLAISCAMQRRNGLGDASLLAASDSAVYRSGSISSRDSARFLYFIGSCLRHRDSAAARRYFGRALRENPWHLRALLRWLAG